MTKDLKRFKKIYGNDDYTFLQAGIIGKHQIEIEVGDIDDCVQREVIALNSKSLSALIEYLSIIKKELNEQ
tara:strand:+ start:54 stop:266 length:213 start_codon:yes stop_codon:yes gene_type:complete